MDDARVCPKCSGLRRAGSLRITIPLLCHLSPEKRAEKVKIALFSIFKELL